LGSLIIFKAAEIIVGQAQKLIENKNFPLPVVGILLLPIITGLPNLFVAISSILHGVTEFVYLNNIGNTIGNLTLVIGITALLGKKFTIRKIALVKRDALFLTVSTLITIFLMADGELSSLDGLALVLVFSFYVFNLNREETKVFQAKKIQTVKVLFFIVFSLALMFIGTELLVSGAKEIIEMTSLSTTFVGVVIISLATLIPEASIMILAARKGKIGLAFSNLVGDSLVSIPLIVGLIAIFFPMTIDAVTISIVLPILALLVIFFAVIVWVDPFLLRIPNKFDIKKHEAVFLILIFFVISGILFFS